MKPKLAQKGGLCSLFPFRFILHMRWDSRYVNIVEAIYSYTLLLFNAHKSGWAEMRVCMWERERERERERESGGDDTINLSFLILCSCTILFGGFPPTDIQRDLTISLSLSLSELHVSLSRQTSLAQTGLAVFTIHM